MERQTNNQPNMDQFKSTLRWSLTQLQKGTPPRDTEASYVYTIEANILEIFLHKHEQRQEQESSTLAQFEQQLVLQDHTVKLEEQANADTAIPNQTQLQ